MTPLPLLLSALALLLPSATSHAADPCPQTAIALTVTPLTGHSAINNRHSQAQMQTLSGIGANAHYGRTPLAMGLTLTRVTTTARISALVQEYLPDEQCATVTALDIGFGFEPHTIYIPKEFVPNSCAYNAIYSHEIQHVNMDKAVLEKEWPRVKARIEAVTAQIGSAHGRDAAALQAELKSRLEARLIAIQNDFSRARERAQAQVDNPGEYARVGNSCGGIIRRMKQP